VKIICLVGQCYSGKSHFIEHHLKRMFPCSVIHLGDYFRQQKFDGVRVSPEVLANTINHLLEVEHFENTVILDNAFKDVEQAEAVLKRLNNYDVSVMWMHDKRQYVDFKKRGREDDTNIKQKRRLWQDNASALGQYLLDKGVDVIRVYNTDEGYVLK